MKNSLIKSLRVLLSRLKKLIKGLLKKLAKSSFIKAFRKNTRKWFTQFLNSTWLQKLKAFFKPVFLFIKNLFARVPKFWNHPAFVKGLLYLKKVARKLKWTAIDRYIILNFVMAFLGSLVLFVAIYQLTQIFNDLKWLPPGTKSWLLIQYYLCNALYWMTILQPFSFLFATVYILSRMAQTRELVAIISTGTSIYRASVHLVIFAVLYYIFMIGFFQNSVVFPAYQQKNILGQIIFNKADPKALDRLKDNRDFSIFGSNSLIYIIGYYNAASREMLNVSIVQLKNIDKRDNTPVVSPVFTNQNEWLLTNVNELTKQRSLVYPDKVNIALRVDVDKAVWENKSKKWIFNIGTIRHVENSGESFIIRTFTNESLPFVVDPPYYFEKIWYPMDAMTYEEGKSYVEKLRKSRQDYKGELANYLSKFSYSLGIIFIVLAGIGIVDLSRRKVSFIMNLMFSLVLFIIYYILFAVGISMSGKGNITPEIGAYGGGALLFVISLFLYRKAKT